MKNKTEALANEYRGTYYYCLFCIGAIVLAMGLICSILLGIIATGGTP